MNIKSVAFVNELEFLTHDTLLLTLSSQLIDFEPGQYMILNIPGDYESREYSIYNRPGKSQLQFLIKIVADGGLTPKLKNLKKGDPIEMEGPFGFFTLPKKYNPIQDFMFISTGTGISPIHSILKSYPLINHKIIHGVRSTNEKYHFQDYNQNHYQSCISRNASNDFQGRVTNYLKTLTPEKSTFYYLSGNSAMINDVSDFLLSHDIPMNQINTEIYF